MIVKYTKLYTIDPTRFAVIRSNYMFFNDYCIKRSVYINNTTISIFPNIPINLICHTVDNELFDGKQREDGQQREEKK